MYRFSIIRPLIPIAIGTLKGTARCKIPFRGFRGTLIFCLMICGNAFPQAVLNFFSNDSVQQQIISKTIKQLRFSETCSDSVSCMIKIQALRLELIAQGFLTSHVESIISDSLSFSAWINTGSRYQWASLRISKEDEPIISNTGIKISSFEKKPLSPAFVAQVTEKILVSLENTGFPFAEVSLDSVAIDNGKVNAAIKFERGNLVIVDSIVIKGTARIAPAYLYNYLSIKPGDVYNESLVRKFSVRIKELPFVSEVKPFGIIFTEDKAKLFLYLNNRKASQVDGVLGVLPDADKSGKVNLTGEARLRLKNSFGRGELLSLEWKQPKSKTQDLKTNFNYPFVISSFGLDLHFDLYKKDTTYLETSREAGIEYLLPGGKFFKAFIKNKNSTLISTKAFESSPVLPPFADIKTTLYGLGFRIANLDYRFNPRKGYAVNITGSAGKKFIEKNSRLKQVDYDSLDLNSTQYNAEGTADLFFPLSNRSVINLGASGAWLEGKDIFENELFRFGGLRSLRGFDEESLFATAFVIGKLEYRYIIEQNSFLFLFFNGAWYENKSRNQYMNDVPYGFGTGITFETKPGIFTISYALGSEQGNRILFRSSKIHFGIINYF